jgi:hypothetical protein
LGDKRGVVCFQEIESPEERQLGSVDFAKVTCVEFNEDCFVYVSGCKLVLDAYECLFSKVFLVQTIDEGAYEVSAVVSK